MWAVLHQKAWGACSHCVWFLDTLSSSTTNLHIDQGREFENNLFTELQENYGMQNSCTAPSHPQGNDQRLNHNLLPILQTKKSQIVANVYNCTHSLFFALFYVLFSHNPRLPIDIMFNICASDTPPLICDWMKEKDTGELQGQPRKMEEGDRLSKTKGFIEQNCLLVPKCWPGTWWRRVGQANSGHSGRIRSVW